MGGHKYQVSRLQRWCEHGLCGCVSIEGACSLLCEAHLYEAKSLEMHCLEFIKVNFRKVVETDAFASLAQDWPQVHLKITLHNAGFEENVRAATLEKQQNARKRKREA